MYKKKNLKKNRRNERPHFFSIFPFHIGYFFSFVIYICITIIYIFFILYLLFKYCKNHHLIYSIYICALIDLNDVRLATRREKKERINWNIRRCIMQRRRLLFENISNSPYLLKTREMRQKLNHWTKKFSNYLLKLEIRRPGCF